MSQNVESNNKSYPVTADIAEGFAVKLSGANVVVATAATDVIIGCTATAIKSGDIGPIKLRSAAGTMKVKLGTGGATVGQALTSDAAGKLIATTTAGNQIVGYALEAGSANDLIEVMPSTAKY